MNRWEWDRRFAEEAPLRGAIVSRASRRRAARAGTKGRRGARRRPVIVWIPNYAAYVRGMRIWEMYDRRVGHMVRVNWFCQASDGVYLDKPRTLEV
jgi:hypothetical protein